MKSKKPYQESTPSGTGRLWTRFFKRRPRLADEILETQAKISLELNELVTTIRELSDVVVSSLETISESASASKLLIDTLDRYYKEQISLIVAKKQEAEVKKPTAHDMMF